MRRRATVPCMSWFSQLFGARRRHAVPTPAAADVAAVDVPRMLDRARDRGDRRTDPEIAASLLVGADLTAERHPDEDLRRRAAAAAVATRDWLVARVGEDETARLAATSLGPIGEDGELPRGRSRRAAAPSDAQAQPSN
jgi:hypothetical protein